MYSIASPILAVPPPEREDQRDHGESFLQTTSLQKHSYVPRNFIWPREDLVEAQEELREPIVDLEGFFKGDLVATKRAAAHIRAACLHHGFFQVTGHGVDSHLIKMAHDHMTQFFELPASTKLRAKRIPGKPWGYSGAHADRFSSKLPWKETLSFNFHENDSNPVVLDFFKSTLGMDFEQMGMVYQKYCEAMKNLSLAILELIAISLGVHRSHYRRFFQDDSSIMRCNYYPACPEPGLAFGTGPHCDPTSVTVLQQDQVGGLEVFVDNKWKTVRPCPDALVINIGDTFVALSNGIYKSCLHRAVVNRHKERYSLAFFLCPKEDKVVRPPEDLVRLDGTRAYPDFRWSDMLEFTQKHHRADQENLQRFAKWIQSSDAVNV